MRIQIVSDGVYEIAGHRFNLKKGDIVEVNTGWDGHAVCFCSWRDVKTDEEAAGIRALEAAKKILGDVR